MVGFGLTQPSLVSWLSSTATSAALPSATLFLDSSPSLTPLGRLPGGWSPLAPTTTTTTTPALGSTASTAQSAGAAHASDPVPDPVGGGQINPLEQLLRGIREVLPAGRTAKQLYGTVQELLGRRNSDDFLFIFLVLINQV